LASGGVIGAAHRSPRHAFEYSLDNKSVKKQRDTPGSSLFSTVAAAHFFPIMT
jgi:hypothetical protein